jgi:hypothetical protein
MQALTPEQRKQLEAALLKAYDLASFMHMLKLELGVILEQEVALNQGNNAL